MVGTDRNTILVKLEDRLTGNGFLLSSGIVQLELKVSVRKSTFIISFISQNLATFSYRILSYNIKAPQIPDEISPLSGNFCVVAFFRSEPLQATNSTIGSSLLNQQHKK